MMAKDFDYNSIEIVCGDLKIIFITDEKTAEIGQTNIHMHSFWELFYLKDGRLSVNTEDSGYVLGKEEMLIIPPDSYHSTVFSEDAIKKSVFFTFSRVKNPESDEKLFEAVHSAFSGCGFVKIEDCEYLAILLEAILENQITDKFAKRWRMKASITEFIFALFDKVHSGIVSHVMTPLTPNTYWVYKYAIDRLLDTHFYSDISLEFLSKKLFTSPQNITRIISSAYGKSFNELKLELKMRNAKKLLRETELSVGEIGERIGYSSPRGFLSAFSRYEGCTPGEYRKKKLQK